MSEQPPYLDRAPRPAAVTAGCVLAWIGAGVGILGGIVLGSLPADSGIYDSLVEDPEAAAPVLRAVGYLYAAWCAVVVALAVLAFHRRKWAATAMLAMAGVVLALTLLSAVGGQGSGLVSGLWSVASALLVHRGGKEWLDGVRR